MSVAAISLVRRCAWCLRVWTGEGWHERPEQQRDRARETATICPDCAATVRHQSPGQ